MAIQIHHNAADRENLIRGCKQRFKPKIVEVDLEVLHGSSSGSK